MAMTPWAYTEDLGKQFNAARFLLGENDPETASLTDTEITSALATFQWQTGMAVLAQKMIVEVGQQVTVASEQGGAQYQWAKDRLNGLQQIKAQADRGTLPDPATGAVQRLQAGTVTLANAPAW